MIVQEVNLYQERFREKRLLLSASQAFLFLTGVILLLALSSYWYQDQFKTAKLNHGNLLEQKQQSAQQLDEMKKKLEKLLADKQVDRQINKVSNGISARKRIIDFVIKNQFGSGKGFSSNLSSLSEINVGNVWLTEISLTEKDIRLSGSALQAEKVPEYFKQFRQHSLFSGRLFDIFQIDRSKKQDWKVDFVIASQDFTDE